MSQKTYSAEQRFCYVIDISEFIVDNRCTIREACDHFGIPPANYRRWRNKLAENQSYMTSESIPEESRRPDRLARKISASTRQRVIEEAHDFKHKSANSIVKHLSTEGIAISVATVIDILEEEGLYGKIYTEQSDGSFKVKRGLLRLC